MAWEYTDYVGAGGIAMRNDMPSWGTVEEDDYWHHPSGWSLTDAERKYRKEMFMNIASSWASEVDDTRYALFMWSTGSMQSGWSRTHKGSYPSWEKAKEVAEHIREASVGNEYGEMDNAEVVDIQEQKVVAKWSSFSDDLAGEWVEFPNLKVELKERG